MGDQDFFDMISEFQNSDGRMEEQRSEMPVIEKPMVYNTELEKAKNIGVEHVVENYETYKGEYIGNAPCFYGNDKETICHQVVFAHFKDKKKINYSPMVARLNEEGITFIIGKSGGASVSIELRDVACCALCPTKPTQLKRLKVVAILARSAGGRRSSMGNKQVGELDLICHMFKLRDEPAMWYFQQQFVHSLNVAFPAKVKKDSTIGRQYNSTGNFAVDESGDSYRRRGSSQQKARNSSTSSSHSQSGPGNGKARHSAIEEEDDDVLDFPTNPTMSGAGSDDRSDGTSYPTTTGKYFVGKAEVVKLQPYVSHKVFVQPTAAGAEENDREMAEQLEEEQRERELQAQRRVLEDAAYARRLQSNESGGIATSITGPMDRPSWNPFEDEQGGGGGGGGKGTAESARVASIRNSVVSPDSQGSSLPGVKDEPARAAEAADVDFSDDDALDSLDLGN